MFSYQFKNFIKKVTYILTTTKKERLINRLNEQIRYQKAIKAFEEDLYSPAQYMG